MSSLFNQKILTRLCFFAALLLMATSCKEDHEVIPSTVSDELTGGDRKTWRLTKVSFVPESGTGGFDFNIDCQVDDPITFIKQGKTAEFGFGDVPCDGEDRVNFTITSSWDVVAATAQIILGGGDPFRLVTLTNDSLVYGNTDTLAFTAGEGIEDFIIREIGFIERTFVPVNGN